MSLIVEKYSYRPLKRIEVDGKRRYDWGGDIPVPSVTTILDSTKDKTHIYEWRKRVGERTATQITVEAAGRGTRMHKYLEDYVGTGVWPTAGSNPYAQQAHNMATLIRDQAITHISEVWGSEVPLYFPKIYAGTTDLVGVYRNHDAILDFKQTNKPKKGEWIEDYFLQLTAYAIAHNEVHGTDIKHGHIFMCSKDLEYQQFDLSPEPDLYFGRTFDDWCDAWWNRVEQYYTNHA